MDDGLFQLMFILVLVVASILDAVTRNRKKRRRMEEMEQEEPGADEARPVPVDAGGGEAETDQGREDWMSAAEAEAEGWDEVDDATSQEEARETADAMVPADLWAILTGQKAPPQPSTPEPSRVPEPVPQDRYREEVPKGPPSGVDRGASSGTEPTTRRSARWMEGLGGRSSDSGWRDEVEVRSEIAHELGEPWDDIPDITEGEIGDDSGGAFSVGGSSGDDPAPDRAVRSLRLAGHYAPTFDSGGVDALRRAVVLKEVLDAPLATRGPSGSGGWEER